MTTTESILIPADEQDDSCERWELPLVQGRLAGNASSSVRPPTAMELKELQKQAYMEAYKAGHASGYKKGYETGHQKALNEYTHRTQTLNQILQHMNEPLEELDEVVEQSMADLISLISRHIVRRELRLDPGEIVGVVREAIGMLPLGTRHPHVYLNPEDVEIVREALSLGEEERTWKLEADPLVARGGCLLETQSSFVDATIESRLSALIAKMLGGERESDQE